MNLVDIQPAAALCLPRLSRRLPTAAPHIHINTCRPPLSLARACAGCEPGWIHPSGSPGAQQRLNSIPGALP